MTEQKNTLNDALHYLKMDELREVLKNLQLPEDGKKVALIQRIICFIETGKIAKSTSIPMEAKAKKGQEYPLLPRTLIVKGAYKNDLKTRLFFKNLIGNHFHFTAYGIDWITDRWMDSNPPTYQEFADFWQQEYERRKILKAPPKQEWAYLNFIQRYLKKFPMAPRAEIMKAWETERLKKVAEVKEFLRHFLRCKS